MAKIHTLIINNFKGIKSFEQTFQPTNFVCLIGRGDSGKTAILEAISAVLSPKWNLTFYDTDFFSCDTSNPISIEASLYDLPPKLLKDSKCGLYIRGLDTADNSIHDELNNNHEPLLTIKLVVEKDLEPQWSVVNGRRDPIEIKGSDRAELNMFFVSDYVDRHFSWNKGNPLYSLLKQEDTAFKNENVIIDALREAKEKIDSNAFSQLEKVVEKIKASASNLGIDVADTHTTIDSRDISIKDGRICLHEENIPFRQKGKGSKRLLSIAIQAELAKSGGIVLIDEIEQGLESDRVRFLASQLKKQNQGQVFITTHSRDVLVELDAHNIYLKKKANSHLIDFDSSFQGCLRNNAEAFFAKKILICEGATEIGICRSINQYYTNKGKPNFSVLGIGIVDGTGSQFITYCQNFKKASFDVCAFCDSDVQKINDQKDELKAMGIEIVDCNDKNAIEQQIFNDLPWDASQQLILYAMDEYGQTSIEDTIRSKISGGLPDDWINSDSLEIKKVLGVSAAKKGWFKRIDHGEVIGEVWCNHLEKIEGTTLRLQFDNLSKWIFDD